jgi:hypothetical protein
VKTEIKLEQDQGPQLAIVLVHYPIMDRLKRVVATNVTNFDIHDIARAATVYGVKKYYIVHPMKEQLMFVDRIIDHWRTGTGSKFNPYRRTALDPVIPMESLEKAIQDWNKPDGLVVATHARAVAGTKAMKFSELKETLFEQKKPALVVFGTGFGLTDEVMTNCDAVLESIRGAPPADYRHLSVRSAVSICLDRILGPW